MRLRQSDPRTGKARTHDEGGFLAMDEVNIKARAILPHWDLGAAVDPSKITIRALVRDFLEHECAHRVRPTTLEDYRATCEKHLCGRTIGTKRAQKLERREVTAWRSELPRETGIRTTQLAFRHLKAALA